MNSRVEKLLIDMKEAELDAIIITDEKNMNYYSGFYNGEGYIVITENKQTVVTDSRYTEYALDKCIGFDVANISAIGICDLVSPDTFCGFENKSISYMRYSAFSKKLKHLVPIGDMADAHRMIKDEQEISYMRKAAEIADTAFEHICSFIKKGMTESEVATEIDFFMRKNGAEGNSFQTIVATGKRGSLPHAMPGETRLKNGDLVVMDFGCKYNGYCSDMTRTVAIGDISSEVEDIYNTVLKAQLKALSVLSSGVSSCDVDYAARGIIDAKYPDTFGHSLGHGVGLNIHELPNLSPGSLSKLKCGNVVTCEPGIYIPGKCGVRIEDMCLVTDNGNETLSKSTKRLIKFG